MLETDGAALTPGVVTGLIVAPAAGVVAGVPPAAGVVAAGVVAGVVLAAAAGVVAVFLAVAAGLTVAFAFGVEATLALGDALAVVAGAFEFLLFRREFFVASGVELVAGVIAGFSVFVADSGVFVLLDFRSVLFVFGVVAGVIAGVSLAVDDFEVEVSVFGAFVIVGFSARGFFSGGPCRLLDCDASGVGS